MRLISGCLSPTQLSYLPVLSNAAPPPLHGNRKAATDNLLQIIEVHPNWPVFADIFQHPPPCPIWSDTTSVNTITQWREDCGRRLLWSTTVLLPILLSDSQFSIFLVIHGLW